jgi:flavin reductase
MTWIDQRPDDAMDGAFAAVGAVSVDTVTPAQFREAMSQLGAAVHVVTTDGPAGKAGFTATAVCPVSDAPATLLICLNRRSQATPVFRANGVLCVNTLSAHDEAMADLFAGRTGVASKQRFETGVWATMKTGSPVLDCAVVSLDCRIVEVKTVATHNIFIVGVEAVSHGAGGPALVYHERAYKRV